MPAAVLCDGAPSALKAVELGGYPNFFVSPTDQLILLHTWSPLRLHHLSASPNSGAVSPSAAGGAGSGREAVPTQNAAGAPSSPQPTASVAQGGTSASAGAPGAGVASTRLSLPSPITTSAAEAIRNAVGSISSEVIEAQRCCLPVPLALHNHLQSIKESRFLKDFLNYKLETASLPLPSVLSTKAEEEPRNPQGKGKTNTRLGSVKPAREEVQPEPLTLEEVTLLTASQTADYARQRAVHHQLDTLLLGVGNQNEGKTITLGHTAEAVLQNLRTQFYLYFIKNEGFTLRPTSTLIRYVVIVTVKNGSLPPPPPLLDGTHGDGKDPVSFVQQDRLPVSGSERNHSYASDGAEGAALPRPVVPNQPFVVHVLDTERRTSNFPNTLTSQNAVPGGGPISSSKGGTPAPFLHLPFPPTPFHDPSSPAQKVVDALEDGLSALRYALSRRRVGTRDAAAVLLVVEPQTEEEEVKRYVSAFEREIQHAPALQGSTGKEDDDEKEGSDVVKNANIPGTAPAVPLDNRKLLQASDELFKIEKKNGEEGLSSPIFPNASEEGNASDHSPKADELWPPVTICSLKVSKHLPNPTVWNSTAQVIKSLQQRRVEFAVLSSSAPHPISNAVLAHHKPHVIIVPSPSRIEANAAGGVPRATSWAAVS